MNGQQERKIGIYVYLSNIIQFLMSQMHISIAKIKSSIGDLYSWQMFNFPLCPLLVRSDLSLYDAVRRAFQIQFVFEFFISFLFIRFEDRQSNVCNPVQREHDWQPRNCWKFCFPLFGLLVNWITARFSMPVSVRICVQSLYTTISDIYDFT